MKVMSVMMTRKWVVLGDRRYPFCWTKLVRMVEKWQSAVKNTEDLMKHRVTPGTFSSLGPPG